MQTMDIIQSLLRWLHVVTGILWIGLLYFFNFVNGSFAATMDGDTKKKVVPQLMPRALYFFRWGATYTWVSGVLLLLLVFYHGGLMVSEDGIGTIRSSLAILAFVLLSPILYDIFFKSPLGKDLKVGATIGFVFTAFLVYFMKEVLHFNYRAYVIHTGAMFGSIMFYNVMFRIWPCQRKIITAIKNGTPPDASLVALAGARSRHNTYLSVPLVWTMINAHTTWAADCWVYLLLAILVGWLCVNLIYKKAGKVQGF